MYLLRKILTPSVWQRSDGDWSSWRWASRSTSVGPRSSAPTFTTCAARPARPSTPGRQTSNTGSIKVSARLVFVDDGGDKTSSASVVEVGPPGGAWVKVVPHPQPPVCCQCKQIRLQHLLKHHRGLMRAKVEMVGRGGGAISVGYLKGTVWQVLIRICLLEFHLHPISVCVRKSNLATWRKSRKVPT